jgi:WD40 repeat protein
VVIATASGDTTVRLWDATCSTRATSFAILEGHKGPVRIVEFSPTGTHLLTASDDTTVRLWNAKTQALLTVLEGHTGGVISAIFSPDGTRVLTTSVDATSLWNAETGESIIRAIAGFATRRNRVNGATFSADGARLIICSGVTARILEAKTGAEITSLKVHGCPVTSAAFSPDGTQAITTSADGTARLWNVHNSAAFAGRPRLVGLLARLRNGVGRIRFEGSDDELLQEVDDDIYAAALKKWPQLKPQVDRAFDILSARAPSTLISCVRTAAPEC